MKVMARQQPEQIVFSPNLWQWYAHHRDHGILPAELSHCRSLIDVYEHLGTDIWSRNCYCDERRCWFGGLADAVYGDLPEKIIERTDGKDLIIEKAYQTPHGLLTERLRHVFAESTLSQEKFLFDDYENQLGAMESLLRHRRWRFVPERFNAVQARLGGGGTVVAGEVYSPLKLLHLSMGPIDTTYLLEDHPERAAEMMRCHEEASLDLIAQMLLGGVKVVMSMDNLDSVFHPPQYVRQYCASFYERASRLCHEHHAEFFIHACGHQHANLPLIASLGVDGLEGVSPAPLGDVEMDEAMRLTNDRFLVSGGITPVEYQALKTRDDAFAYVEELFGRMRPYANRFIFSASCNIPYTASWDMIVNLRDAWKNYRRL
jgi:uroporphyrinogen-III decarboxylase